VGAAYESIKLDLRKKILAKTWLTGIKIPSSRELAAIYNCSTNTIEKSLRDLQNEGLLVREARRGTYVSEKAFPTQSQSVRIISDTIAVVVDDVNSYIFSKAFRGIEDVLKTRGFGLTISSHDNDPELQESILKGLIQQGVRGIILYPALAFEDNTRYYKNLETLLEKTSIVCMDRYIYNSSLSMPYVTSDNFYASYQLTSRLIENGHRQIGFVRNYNVSTVIERLMGCKQAFHDHGLPFKDDMDILLHGTNKDMQAFPTDWLAPRIASLGLTAFFTTNYNLAGHIMNGLSKLGLSIPKDISLVSYEVEYMNSFMPIKITGVTQRFYEMGKAAARIIVNLLDNSHESDMTGYICHSILNVGESIRKIDQA
jgi:GntR family transcriptional regulator of arabinose operon